MLLGWPGTLRGRLLALALPLLLCAAARSGLAVDRQKLTGHVPALAANQASVGRLPAEQRMKLAIGLPLRNQEELNLLLQQLYDPASPVYHAYLTPQDFAQRFGPTEQDYQAVMAFATARHLNITKTSPNRVILNVEGAVSDIENAFHVTLRTYQHPTEARQFYAPDAEPTLDLAVPVLRISGLENSMLPHPMNLRKSSLKAKGGVPMGGSGNGGTPMAGSGPQGNYMGNDFRAAYVPGSVLTGVGQSVALYEMDGFFPSDIAQYATMAGLPNVPLQTILLDGFNGTPGFANVEVALDIEMCMAMAPGLAQILVYEGNIAESIVNQIAVDNAASQVSCSWSWGGGPSPLIDQIFQQMAAQGQSWYNASGDYDAWPPGVADAYAPIGSSYITLVGGTTLTTSGPGGAWVSETVWQWGFDTGSGGGVSSYYTIPSWQKGVNMTTNGGSATMRNLPDVALTADNIVVVADGGQVEPGTGGTSAAAPLWAAFTALVNQQAVANGQQTVGFINPALYSIAKNTALYRQAFHDIATGNNTNSVMTNLYYAVPGYDLCTGWGTPAGTYLINLLAPPTGFVPLLRYATNYLVGGNGNGLIDPNECNSMLIVLTNFGSVTATGVRATLSTTTPGVVIAQPTSLYPTMLTNGAGTNLVAFRISTAPTFACGTPVHFNLAVTSDQSFNTVRFNFQLNSGSPATPLRYDGAGPVTVPSLGTVNSAVTVSNFPSALTKAVVSVFAMSAYDAGLELMLVAPDGSTNILTASDGGSGQNFGVACSPETARTTFDDAGPTTIAGGFAPFSGSYQPQQPLSSLIGKSGTNVNGTWKLRALDLYGLGATIQCWSLILTPANCTDGGGECPGADMGVTMTAAPDPLIIGDYVTYTITVTNGGPSGVQAASLTQLLPSGISLVSASPSQGGWTLSGNVLTFGLGSMAARSSATITVIGQAIAQGTFTTTATASSEQPDYNPANNVAAAVSHVHVQTADLAVSLSVNPSTIFDGDTFTYTVTVVNNGPSSATGVLLTNTLPVGVVLISPTSSQGTVTVLGNQVVCSLGTLTNASSAVTTLKVQAVAEGALMETSQVTADQTDPVAGNNTASVTVVVGPTADLGVSVVENPNPVVLNSNLTYFVTVTNRGPSVATGVLLTFALDPSLTFVSASLSQGTGSLNGNTWTAVIGTMASGGAVQVTLRAAAGIPGSVVSVASVVGKQPDRNQSNNSVAVTTQVAYPFVTIVPAGATLTSNSFSPPNGIIENGETVTVSLRLRNAGNVANTNLQATLLATNGVTPVAPNNPQSFGVLRPSGLPTGRSFTFTANGAPGATISAVLLVKDAGGLTTNIAFNFTLPTILTFSNNGAIAIVDDASAMPYPSPITVSGVTGTLARVTATLSNFGHTYPKDVDVLLVAPSGANALLLSHAGNSVSSSANLTFDDTSSNYLPVYGPLLTGTYHPTAYGLAPVFASPAPAGPYTAGLSSVFGGNPNGQWKLFVEDDAKSDAGGITNGWSLALTLATPVNPLADLALYGSGPASSTIPANLIYTYTISNSGPSSASYVVFSNALPAGVAFVAASPSALSLIDGAVVGTLGSLAAGGTATVTVTVATSVGATGLLTNTASVSATEVDLNPINNVLSIVTLNSLPAADLAVSSMISPNPAVAGFMFTNNIVVTNSGNGVALNASVSSWLPTNAVYVTALSTNGFPSTNGSGLFTCGFGNLPANASGSVSLVLLATGTDASGVGTNAPLLSIVSATSSSIDPNLANNSVTNLIPVNNPSPSLRAAGAALVSERGTVNGALDLGDTVTLLLAITNAGTFDTSTNLTASLQSSGGISPSGYTSQVYGIIPHGGSPVATPFTFTVTNSASKSVSGGLVVATLLLTDVQTLPSNVTVTNQYSVSYTFSLATTLEQTNSAYIVIPTIGPATPYPSVVNVSGLSGIISKTVATVHGLYHTFPSDIEAILVSPAGQAVALMANAGYSFGVDGLRISFDDTAPAPLPQFAALHSGTYQPTAYNPLGSLPSPAPGAPYGSALAAFNGSNPNGAWSLYVYDHKSGDSGGITAGWDLDLTTVIPIGSAGPSLQIQPLASGTFQVVLIGVPGTTYLLQTSPDLSTWTSVSTNTATAIPSVLPVNPQAASRVFYRAVAQP